LFVPAKFTNQETSTSRREKQNYSDAQNQNRYSQIYCDRDRQPNSGPKRDVRSQAHWAFWNKDEDRAWNNPAEEIDSALNN
jgi:hypothetical protein